MSRARPLVLPCSSDAFVLVSALVAGWRCTCDEHLGHPRAWLFCAGVSGAHARGSTPIDDRPAWLCCVADGRSRWCVFVTCGCQACFVHAIAWVRVVRVRRCRCLVVQRFDRSRSKPNNARALRCPRLRAMDVEHFDFESDQNQTRDGKPLALSSNHLLSRGSLLRNRQSSNDRCAR